MDDGILLHHEVIVLSQIGHRRMVKCASDLNEDFVIVNL